MPPRSPLHANDNLPRVVETTAIVIRVVIAERDHIASGADVKPAERLTQRAVLVRSAALAMLDLEAFDRFRIGERA